MELHHGAHGESGGAEIGMCPACIAALAMATVGAAGVVIAKVRKPK